mgnify:CR=1 FL=1
MLRDIRLVDPDDLLLTTRDGVRVRIGQAVELDKKLGWLKSDAYAEVLEKGESGILDVSVPGKAVFHPESLPEGQEGSDGESSGDAGG